MEERAKLITDFDVKFTTIDHEIIKMVLQSCDWNSTVATTVLNDMIESSPALKVDSEKESKITGDDSSWNRIVSRNYSRHISNAKEKSCEEIPLKKPEITSEKCGKLLILMRGLPGSGKTTLANSLIDNEGVINSTDDFFYDFRGNYVYNIYALEDAHLWNKKRTEKYMLRGVTPIIIDNTNIEAWEMKPYALLSMKHHYKLQIIEPDTPWKFKPNELARRNCHSVPKQKIEEMLDRYDHTVTTENIMPTEYRKKQSPVQKSLKKREEVQFNSKEIDADIKRQSLSKLYMYNEKKNLSIQEPILEWNEPIISNVAQIETKQRKIVKRKGNPNKWFQEDYDNKDSITEKWSEESFSAHSWQPEVEEKCEKMNSSQGTQTSSLENECDTILYGNAKRFVPGPLKTYSTDIHILKLDAGCMTEDRNNTTVDMAMKQLSLAFESCSTDDLLDVLEKCHYNIDWAVNILIDGGYKMSDNFYASNIDSGATLCQDNEENDKLYYITESDCPDESLKRTDSQNQNNEIFADIPVIPTNINTPVDKNRSVEIKLDKNSAHKLIELFGPINIFNETIENATINLPIELCEILHQFWITTFESEQALPSAETKQSEIYAAMKEHNPIDTVKVHSPTGAVKDYNSTIGAVKDYSTTSTVKAHSPTYSVHVSPIPYETIFHDSKQNTEVVGDDPFTVEPPKSFREIMEIEKAVTDSLKSNSTQVKSLSSILSLNKMKSEFPHVDPNAVETCFIENNCNYKKTVTYLIDIFKEKKLKSPSPKPISEGNDQQHFEFKSIEDYRNEAKLHFHKKQSALKKSRINLQKNMPSVASFYSQEAAYHAVRQIEADDNAAKLIVESYTNVGNNTLDLHRLYVSEAISAAQAFFAEKIRWRNERNTKQTELILITGYGKTIGERSRVKMAIIKYLASLCFSFHEDSTNKGMIHVFL